MASSDWNPAHYGQFADLRLRPAIDLLGRVGDLPPGDIVDLGCGSGAAGPVLRSRFDGRRIVGIDRSPAMLAKAAALGCYDALSEQDVAAWQPDSPPALIFSNATLHWLGDHETLLPRLAAALAPGGTLAVQVPHQNRAPSHRLWHDLVAEHMPGRFDPAGAPGILAPAAYFHLLSGIGTFDLWETEYYQVLPAADTGHPVRHFTSSTYARPVLDALDAADQARLTALYDDTVGFAYPLLADGSVLFPFRRLFFTLIRPR
ncbi:MAG: methyltransferase domain-containing protein [Roseivivax sp.]|nr:methyltransferase domain-containing protein [Roseivivax sp.]